MTWHALFYPLQPGSAETVTKLFQASGRPDFDVRNETGEVVGRLLGTLAFVGERTAVRVMEINGLLPVVAAHMSRQPQVREFEINLEDHLAVPRDMRSPDGARDFFRQAGMHSLRMEMSGYSPPAGWRGRYYRLRPGGEAALARFFAAYSASSAQFGAFVGEAKGLWIAESDGLPDATAEATLADHLDGRPSDLECVLVRRHDRDL